MSAANPFAPPTPPSAGRRARREDRRRGAAAAPGVQERPYLAIPDSLVELITLAQARRTLTDVLASVCEQVAASTDSDVAVLLPRDERWHVTAGCGLRALEWRDLDALPHALSQLSPHQPVLTVGESESVRPGVIGAPLSRHRSMLLALAGGAIWVLGRHEPYRQDDIQALTAAVNSEREDLLIASQLAEAADALEHHRLG